MRIYLVPILLLISMSSIAQIKGTIQDDQGVALPFANVLLLELPDSSVAKGAVSEVDGKFSITPEKDGKFLITINMISFDTWKSELIDYKQGDAVDLGAVKLQTGSMALEGVKIEVKQDLFQKTAEGTIVNVQNSVMTKGSTLLDLLERSPGVVVDERNNQISLNGQSGTMVMINGKIVRIPPEQLTQYLEGMSGDNVAQIEILTNPSAKYDVDGNAGLINIVLKKSETDGVNGNFSVTGGYGYGAKGAASANINYRKGKNYLYGSYSYNYDDGLFSFIAIGDRDMRIIDDRMTFDVSNETVTDNRSHTINVGYEYDFNDKTNAGLNVMYNPSNSVYDMYTDGYYTFGPDSATAVLINSIGDYDNENINSSVFMSTKVGEKSELHADAEYLVYKGAGITSATNEYKNINGEVFVPQDEFYATEYRGSSFTDLNVGVLKLDFESNLSNKLKFETGAKTTYSFSENDAVIEQQDNGEWITDSRGGSAIQIKESIGAAYVNGTYQLDSVTKVVAGLRYEYWDRDFSDATPDRSFGKLFPSVFVTRYLSQSAQMTFAYTRRITRPSYRNLASYVMYNDPTSVFGGNPLLRPALTDNIKVGYSNKGKSLSLVFMNEQNPIAGGQISEDPESDLVIISPQNMGYQRSLALEFALPFQISKWWNLMIGGSIGRREFEIIHLENNVVKPYNFFMLNGGNNFMLPKNFTIELSGFYLSDFYDGAIDRRGFGQLNFGVKKVLPKNWGSLQFAVTDVFKGIVVDNYGGTLTRDAFDAKSFVQFKSESGNFRIFKLTYAKSLGNNKLKGKKQRKAGAEEEKSRMN